MGAEYANRWGGLVQDRLIHMANAEQLARLDEGVDSWNRWRAGNPQATVDLSEATLEKKDLTGADLQSALLPHANLRGAKLRRGTRLRKADLQHAAICEADLSGADLMGMNLAEVDLFEASLREADLESADLSSLLKGVGSQHGHQRQSENERAESAMGWKSRPEGPCNRDERWE